MIFESFFNYLGDWGRVSETLFVITLSNFNNHMMTFFQFYVLLTVFLNKNLSFCFDEILCLSVYQVKLLNNSLLISNCKSLSIIWSDSYHTLPLIGEIRNRFSHYKNWSILSTYLFEYRIKLSMVLQFYRASKCIGFAPLFNDKIKINWILPVFLFLANQIRSAYVIYIQINLMLIGHVSSVYGVLSIISFLFEHIFVSICLCSTIAKLEKWKNFQKIFFGKKIHNAPHNLLIWIICTSCYLIVLLTEYFSRNPIDGQLLFNWLNFHIYQLMQYFHLYFVRNVVLNITQKYVKFDQHFRNDMESAASMSSSIKKQILRCGQEYLYFYKMVAECTDLFSWSILAVIIGIFMNILAGIMYLLGSSDINTKNFPVSLGAYIVQNTISLVSGTFFICDTNLYYKYRPVTLHTFTLNFTINFQIIFTELAEEWQFMWNLFVRKKWKEQNGILQKYCLNSFDISPNVK